jgi:hypothetical protein
VVCIAWLASCCPSITTQARVDRKIPPLKGYKLLHYEIEGGSTIERVIIEGSSHKTKERL